MWGKRATGVPAGTFGSGSGAGSSSFKMLDNAFHGSWVCDCRGGPGVGCLDRICQAVDSDCLAVAMAILAYFWQVGRLAGWQVWCSVAQTLQSMQPSIRARCWEGVYAT